MAAVTLVLVTDAGAGADRAGWRKLGRDGRDILTVLDVDRGKLKCW